jgi:hypothetical protein
MTGSIWKNYGYGWVTLGFFLISFVGHWVFGWFAYVGEQSQHNAPVEVSAYLVEMSRDTLENWQSEFLQLLWQIGGLALLLYVGSPQSKEGADRIEQRSMPFSPRSIPKRPIRSSMKSTVPMPDAIPIRAG